MDLKYSRARMGVFPSNAKTFHRALPSSHNPCLWHRGPSVLIFGDGERVSWLFFKSREEGFVDPSEDDSSLKFKGILGSVCVFSQSPFSRRVVLVSHRCHCKLLVPQTSWLKTTSVDCLTVLESRVQDQFQ